MERLETTILRNLLSDEEYTRKVMPFLKNDYFHDHPERLLFQQIESFVTKYNSLPTTEALVIDLGNDSDIGELDFESAQSILSSFTGEYEKPAAEWLADQTEHFCQEKAVYNAVMESIQILDGKQDKMKESIPEILSDALAISFDTNVGHDYLEDSDKRFDFYHKRENHIPFDLEYFNNITNGGVCNKTLNVLMAGPGVGKTLAMCHFAASYLSQGKNVLYVTLEMAEERISERIDANLLNVSLNDLYDLPKVLYDSKIQKLRDNTVGKLIVKEFPTAQAGVGHFRHLFNELNLKKSFVPNILIVDYINICTSSRYKPGANINSYTYIKSIAEEMRGFAIERNIPVITATQVNREGFGSSDMGMENTAESFGLPATADLFLAIITSDELESLNQLMVKQLKNRYNDPTVHRRFVVGVDRAKMRLYDVDQSAQQDISDDASNTPTFDNTSFGKRDFSQINI
jgi:replicative DNA helicase